MSIFTNTTTIKNHPSFDPTQIWQSILDIGFEEWNSREDGTWGYEDMLKWVELNYGSFTRFLIQLGKYNHQVGNGGHRQYFSNGYASNGDGCNANHSLEVELHTWMLQLARKTNRTFLSADKKKSLISIMTSFKSNLEIDDEQEISQDCDSCYGVGEIEDGYCNDCGGTGEEFVDNDQYGELISDFSDIDDRYYSELNATIKEDVENYLKELFSVTTVAKSN